jgi:5-methylcytosine-specific restriction protein A
VHKVAAGSFSDKRRGSRHERGYGAAWAKLRLLVLARDAGLCQVHAERGQIVPGSIVNLAAGGEDDEANLQAICADCHTAKTLTEMLAARGIDSRAPAASCTAAGMPTDPAHPWNQPGRGGEISTARRPDTDPQPNFCVRRFRGEKSPRHRMQPTETGCGFCKKVRFNMTDATAFFSAAGDLAGALLDRLKRDDPESSTAVASTLKAGGFLTLTVAFGVAGPIDTRLQLVGPAGERTTLFEVGDEVTH